jgi:hypothetical protein
MLSRNASQAMYNFAVKRLVQFLMEPAVSFSQNGGVAEWLCSGLQSRGRRFDSDPRLQNFLKTERFPADVLTQN